MKLHNHVQIILEYFANYWVTMVLTMKKKKCLNHLEILNNSEVLKRYNGQVIRLALLSAHYKQPLDWNENLLEQSKDTLEKWYELYDEKKLRSETTEIFSSLLDDLNTPKYFAKLHELYKLASKGDKIKEVNLMKLVD